MSQINSLVKVALEEKLPSRLVVRGQISDWKHHSSGHCYFSLKDTGGVLPCVMWASKFRNVRFSPEDGLEVLATGCIDVYMVGGKYQFYADKLEPAGVGALQLAFEQLVAKLTAEGLFDEAHKKPLPRYPVRIAMLTSESGAATHDIADSIHSRWPCARLFLYPVPVQGEGAAEKIATALRDINRRNESLGIDVLIVARGGGSLEDLWPFNEEVLARAIFDSGIPVISAVGHEVDTTIADLVADARASTPTKAGIVAVPDAQEVSAQLSGMLQRLKTQTEARLKTAKQDVEIVLANALFRNPATVVQNAAQQLDESNSELDETIGRVLLELRRRLAATFEQTVRMEPHRLLGKKAVELNNWQNRVNLGVSTLVNNRRVQLTAQASRLTAMNPKSVLQRGYSITTSKKTGSVLRAPGQVQVGDDLLTELAGEILIESRVTKK
ncbi:MAG: exodeoxyribonuclease VII large subunit [Planctomycetota bacterium]